MKLLCTGDLHLGAGADLCLAPGERLAEQEAVLDQIVDLAVERNVVAVLFAGDAFEGPGVTPEQYAAFQRPLRRLASNGIPPMAITGNGRHDAAMRDVKALEVLSDVAQVCTVPAVDMVADDQVAVSVCMLPWTPVSRIVAAHDGDLDRDNVNVLASELLVEVARGLRARVDGPAILMTHFSITGASLPTGMPVDQMREPVLDLGALEDLGFDAIVAGHIHKPQDLATNPAEPEMPIFYVGSPMPLNFGEGGYDHGVTILHVDQVVERMPSVQTFSPEFVAITSRPFVTIDLDLAYQADAEAVESLVDLGFTHGVESAFVKLRYTATEEQARRTDQSKLREVLEQSGAYRVWIEQTVEREHRERGAVLDDAGTRHDQLAAYLEAMQINGTTGAAMLERAKEIIA